MTLCIPVSMVNAFARYEQHQVALAVRSRLLDYVNECYLNSFATFYRVNMFGRNLLSTVDQRITTDIEQFSEKMAETWGSILRPTFEIAVYSYNIYVNLGLPHLLFFVGYFFGTSMWLKSKYTYPLFVVALNAIKILTIIDLRPPSRHHATVWENAEQAKRFGRQI